LFVPRCLGQITLSGSASVSGGAKLGRYVGTDYASCTFEADTFCQFQLNNDANSGVPVVSTDFAYAGSKSAKGEVKAVAGSFVSELVWLARNIAPYNHTGPKNPALTEPAGVCVRYRFLFPTASIAEVSDGDDQQDKIFRTRMNYDSPTGGWVSGTVGRNAGQGTPYNEWVSFNESGNPTTGWTYQIGASGKSGIQLQGNTWYTFIECMKHNGTTGRAQGWLNGTLLFDTGQQSYLGSGNANDEQSFEFLNVALSGPDSPPDVSVFVYGDDLLVTASDISP